MDWLDLLAVQGTLKSLLQHHSSKASILQHLAFFKVQFTHPYITTGKTIALTTLTFVGKEMSLLFNMLSRLVITFLPRSKHLLISWLQSPLAVILEPPQIKSVTIFTVSPYICHEVMEADAMILVFWILSFKPTFTLSSFTFIKRLFSSFLSPIRVVSSAYLRLLIFLHAILIPACASSSPAFLMMYSAYKLKKQGDNIQPWCILFPIWNQSVVPSLVLTVAFWTAYRSLKRQVRRSGMPISKNFPQFVVIHTVKGFGIVNKAEIDVFLELSCFFNYPTDVGDLFSGSSAFSNLAWTSESSQFTYCWSLAWRILSITLLLCEMSAIVLQFEHSWHCLSLGLEWKLSLSSPVVTAEFSKFAGILSAALSQHHLLGFEITQLEFRHLH